MHGRSNGGGGAPFFRGLALGVTLALAAVAFLAGLLQQQGLTVQVETAEVARRLDLEVQAAVRRELPTALAAVQAELPGQVATEAGRRLAATQLDIGGFQVPVPLSVVRQVESAVEQALRAGITTAARSIDVDAVATRMGAGAAAQARTQLDQLLAGQHLSVQVTPGFAIPLRLEPR